MKSFLLLALLSPVALLASRCEMNGPDMEQEEKKIRPAILADTWYEGTKSRLRKQIDGFLDRADPVALDGPVRGLICPHAGVVYSGPTAAVSYKTLRGAAIKRVIVLAPSHRHSLRCGSIADVTHYATPLGEIPLDRGACEKLLAHKGFSSFPEAHKKEHSVEIQLPFLQRVIGEDFSLIPVLVGQVSAKECKAIAEALLPYWDDTTLLVASSDFTHYGRSFGYLPFDDAIPEKLSELDHGAIDFIEAVDADGFARYIKKTGATICGRNPISVLLSMTKKKGYAARELAYTTSGEKTGDWSHTVSYAALAILGKKGDNRTGEDALASEDALTSEDALSDSEKNTLLRLARDTLRHHLKEGKELSDLSRYTLTGNLKAKRGAFVTLNMKGRLRGCIGYLQARGPLYQAVIQNTLNAAAHDPRFPAVTAREEPDIRIEISVLSPVIRVKNPEEIKVGRDGLIISKGYARGTLLPQVATEYGWDRIHFLEQTCRKAGLPRDAWKEKDTKIERYEAQFFGESEK